MIVLEYESHGKSFENAAEADYEDTCKIKQGHLGIVTRKERAAEGDL